MKEWINKHQSEIIIGILVGVFSSLIFWVIQYCVRYFKPKEKDIKVNFDNLFYFYLVVENISTHPIKIKQITFKICGKIVDFEIYRQLKLPKVLEPNGEIHYPISDAEISQYRDMDYRFKHFIKDPLSIFRKMHIQVMVLDNRGRKYRSKWISTDLPVPTRQSNFIEGL